LAVHRAERHQKRVNNEPSPISGGEKDAEEFFIVKRKTKKSHPGVPNTKKTHRGDHGRV